MDKLPRDILGGQGKTNKKRTHSLAMKHPLVYEGWGHTVQIINPSWAELNHLETVGTHRNIYVVLFFPSNTP